MLNKQNSTSLNTEPNPQKTTQEIFVNKNSAVAYVPILSHNNNILKEEINGISELQPNIDLSINNPNLNNIDKNFTFDPSIPILIQPKDYKKKKNCATGRFEILCQICSSKFKYPVSFLTHLQKCKYSCDSTILENNDFVLSTQLFQNNKDFQEFLDNLSLSHTTTLVSKLLKNNKKISSNISGDIADDSENNEGRTRTTYHLIFECSIYYMRNKGFF